MVAYSSPAGVRTQPLWLCLLLGIVFIIAGLVVLGDVVFATIVSAMIIGICAIAGGVFEVVHAFWTKGWGGFIWQIILGLLYIAGGVLLVTQPVNGALILTWVIGVVFFASGIVRLVVGGAHWSEGGWLIVISGVFAMLAGLVILLNWPVSGLWVIGFILGLDLVIHGFGWLIFAFSPRAREA